MTAESMPPRTDRTYLLHRERQARAMAERAAGEATRRLHLRLADHYARRAAPSA